MTSKEIAEHFFARNSKINTLYTTSDGQGFSEKQQAEGHAQRLKDQKVETHERNVRQLPNKPVDLLDGNVKAISEKVATITVVEDLEALAEKEKEGQDRKGVQSVIAERIEELTKKTNHD